MLFQLNMNKIKTIKDKIIFINKLLKYYTILIS